MSELKIFTSYSHADAEIVGRLNTHFAVLRQRQDVKYWTDKEIPIGEYWENAILQEIESADIILLMISAAFFDSKFCFTEMQIAMRRAAEGSARVVPILLKPCAWQATPLANIQGLPEGMKPISQEADQESLLAQITMKLAHLIDDIAKRSTTIAKSALPSPEASTPGSERANGPETKTFRLYNDMRRSTVFFADRFATSFPGVRGAKEFTGEEATYRLSLLLRDPLSVSLGNRSAIPIWWFSGHRSMQIESFKRTGKTEVLMDVYEMAISKLIACQSNSYFRSFVYLETLALSPTGLYEKREGNSDAQPPRREFITEEYGLYKGHFVSRTEYDDGAAEIDGRIVDIRGESDLRVRYVAPTNMIICAHANPINNNDFDEISEQILNDILEGESSIEELVQAANRLPKKILLDPDDE